MAPGRSGSWMSRLVAGLLLAGTLATGAAHADSLGDVRTGNAAFGDGRYEAAVEAFTRAILAGDLDHEALAITLNNRGVAYSELGDYDRAIADYQQGLALVPGDPTATRNLRIAYTRRAAAAARLGDRAAAFADYDRAIELEPTHPLAYLRRGQLALERGDRAAAIADLTKARDLDPQNADVAALLAGTERMPATPDSDRSAAAGGRATDRPGGRSHAAGRCRTCRRLLDRSAGTVRTVCAQPTRHRACRRRAGTPVSRPRGRQCTGRAWERLCARRWNHGRRCGDGRRRAPRLAAAAARRWRYRVGLREVAAGGRRRRCGPAVTASVPMLVLIILPMVSFRGIFLFSQRCAWYKSFVNALD